MTVGSMGKLFVFRIALWYFSSDRFLTKRKFLKPQRKFFACFIRLLLFV